MKGQFPKTRPGLPPEFQKVYQEWMQTNRGGRIPTTSLTTRLEGWMHRKVAGDLRFIAPARAIDTLELGAGTLNHLRFDRRSNHYDAIEPSRELLAISVADESRVRTIYSDLSEIPADVRYDRVVSIAVLEHLCDLPEMLRACASHLKPEGVFRAGIPSAGTLLWELGWRLTTARSFRSLYGLDYGTIMRHEHVNTSTEIVAECRKVFRKVRVSSFGVCSGLSIYQFIEASDPCF